MKICSRCKKEKELKFFNKNKTKEDGYQTFCKSCQSEYQKVYYVLDRKGQLKRVRQRKIKLTTWFKEYKKTLKCTRCPENHPACLDFHHPAGDKKFNTGQMARNGYSKKKVLEEVSKCVVLCANCHRKEHNKGR